tara:strand:- start:37 stop:342 length:306 start_codon:yes stop_codon:yes gene_type:complete
MTAQLKPKPIRKKRTSSSFTKTMTEQTKPPLQTLTKVQSHLPEYQLIDRNALWEDFKNRIKINNYEVSEAMKQLKDVVNHTHKIALPYVDKAVKYVKAKQQ